MSTEESPRLEAAQDEKKLESGHEGVPHVPDIRAADGSSLKGEDILALQDLDPALNMKMHLVNNVRGVVPVATSGWHSAVTCIDDFH